MHLEGKLHTGYLKIRNKLAELKQRRNRDRSPGRDNRVVRRREPAPKEVQEDNEIYDSRMIFASRKHHSGANLPPGVSAINFAEMAIQKNRGYAAHDS